MTSTETATRSEHTQRAHWVEHYRGLTAQQLVARTLSLRIAAKRGRVADAELRFQVLEAEQAYRAEYPIRFSS